ncbi:MAG: iron chelate uptake ABC transporter family permease subunit, partial [Chloroflexota bacterium]
MASSPHPYIPNTDEDRCTMLDAIGVATADELFADIPVEFRIDGLDLPPTPSELDLSRELSDVARQNRVAGNGTACFLGGASCLVLAGAGARVVLAPTELPVGVITGLVGGPFFLA